MGRHWGTNSRGRWEVGDPRRSKPRGLKVGVNAGTSSSQLAARTRHQRPRMLVDIETSTTIDLLLAATFSCTARRNECLVMKIFLNPVSSRSSLPLLLLSSRPDTLERKHGNG